MDFNSWKEKKLLKINMVNGHPYEERITLLGEVLFPNLQIQPSSLEFGCILAGTKDVRSLWMTNCSPLPVQYHWSFHADSRVNRLRYVHFCPLLEALLPGVLFVLWKRQSSLPRIWQTLLTFPCANNTDPQWPSWKLRE